MTNIKNCKVKNVVPFCVVIRGLKQEDKFTVYEDNYYKRKELEAAMDQIENILKSKGKVLTELLL